MAVYNNYVDTNILAGKLANAALVSGVVQVTAVQKWSIAAGDDATSIFRVFKGIDSDSIIVDIEIMNDAVTGATGALIGLYNVLDFDGVGAIIASGNQFNTNFNLSSANAIATGWVTCYTAAAIADREKSLWELAAQTQAPGAAGPKAPAYDICLTMVNKTASATGDVVMKLTYLRAV